MDVEGGEGEGETPKQKLRPLRKCTREMARFIVGNLPFGVCSKSLNYECVLSRVPPNRKNYIHKHYYYHIYNIFALQSRLEF